MILKDVTVNYVRVDPARPDMNFNKERGGQWSFQIFTRKKEQAKEWREANIDVKMDEDDEGAYYKATLSKPVLKADKLTKSEPIEVVNGDLVAIDPNSIGNGTVCNIRVYQYEYTHEGLKNIKTLPQALQVLKHIVNTWKPGPREGFEPAVTETIEPKELPDNDAEDFA